MANKLKFKRGLAAGIPNGDAAEPLFTTDTYDLYIGKGDGTNQRFQKYIASGATTQILRGDGSLYTFPLAISSPVAGQVLKYNGTSWTNDSDTDTGITTLNTLTATTQTFATGTSGTDFNISSATSTHTFNIPTASATNRGALSSADWTTFNSKIGGSGTSGQVAYFNGTSSITSESNLFWDAANDRLGIGTITPGASLAVNGNAFFAAKITIKGNAAGTLGNSSGLELYQDAVTDTSYLYNFYNGPLLLGTNNTERVRIASSGNVGIGTTSPTVRLHVISALNSDVAIFSGANLDRGLKISTAAGIQNDAIAILNAQNTYGVLAFHTASSEKMRLDSSGNLGLGVTPSAWDAGIKAFEIFSSGNAIISSTSSQNILTTNARYVGGGWKYGSNGLASTYQQQSGVHTWNLAPSGTAGNTITFTQAMTLDASGRLGIGTTSPSYLLDVNGTMRVSGASTFARITTVTSGVTLDYNSGILYHAGGSGNYYQFISGADYYISNRTATGSLVLRTVDTDRLTISSTGAATFSSTATATAFIPSGSSVPTNGMYLPTTNTLAWATNTTERMRITSGGSVGIGTASPAEKLDVAGNVLINTGYKIYGNSNAGSTSSYISLYNVVDGGIDLMANFTTSKITFGTNATERMRLTSAGELLINTTTDAGDYKLQVAGNAYMTDSVVIGGTSSTTGSLDVYKGVLGVSANARFKVSGDYADAYQFRILGISAGNFNSTTYASIDNSGNGYFAGNLGVGVVSPTEKLEVNGNIKTAAPSGGTAKPWKLGEVTGGTGTHNNSIKVEVDGSIYYLMAYVV